MAENSGLVIPLGGASLTFNGVELGHTTPNTKATFKTKILEATAAKYGEVPIGIFRAGTRVEIDAELEQTDLLNVQGSATGSPYPQLYLVSGSGKTKLTFGEIAGKKSAAQLLKVTSFLTANTPAYDFTLTQAVPIGDPVLIYQGDKIQVWAVKFVGVIDEGKADGSYLGSIGDTTATVDAVAPTVSGVVPAENASSVPVASPTTVTWTLSKSLNGTLVNNKTVKLFLSPSAAAGTEVACGVPVLTNAGASTTIALTTSGNLTSGKTYMAMLTNEIQDQVGNTLATYISEFST